MNDLFPGVVTFDVSIMPASGDFEVSESGARVVSGRISQPESATLGVPSYERPAQPEDNYIPLTSSDVYKELRLRGYDYGPTFQVQSWYFIR